MPQDSRQRASKPLRQQTFARAKAPALPILHDVTDKLEQLPPSTSAAIARPNSPGALPEQPSLQITMAIPAAVGRRSIQKVNVCFFDKHGEKLKVGLQNKK